MNGFSWDWSFAWSVLPELLAGLKVTVTATLLGTILALAFGLLWTLLRLADIPLVSPAIDLMVQFLRGTPLLIQLYFFFYALPGYGVTLSALATGILGLGLFYSAVASEVYRAGVEGIAPGQWEASLTLGLPLLWMWRRIVLPQALRSVIPMLGNIVVVMFKDTALLSTITIAELLSNAMDAAQTEYRFIEPLTLAALFYFIVSYTSVQGVRVLERWSATGG